MVKIIFAAMNISTDDDDGDTLELQKQDLIVRQEDVADEAIGEDICQQLPLRSLPRMSRESSSSVPWAGRTLPRRSSGSARTERSLVHGTAFRYLMAVLVVAATVAAAASGCTARTASAVEPASCGSFRWRRKLPKSSLAGAGRQLVGATDQCDYPPEREIHSPRQRLRHTQYRDAAGPRAEHGHCLRAGEAGDPRGLAAVRNPRGGRAAQGFHGRLSRPDGPIRTIGDATGRAAEAQALVSHMETELQAVAARVAAIEEAQRPRVFVEIDKSPLMTAGRGSFIDDMITRAGGRNVAHPIQTAYPRIDPEQVIAWNPDVILVGHSEAAGAAAKRLAQQIGWSNIAAVRERRIIDDIDPDLLFRPGPRLVEGVKQLAERLAR